MYLKNRNYCILKCRFREMMAQNERQSREIDGENELKSSLRMPSHNEDNELIYHQSQIIKFSWEIILDDLKYHCLI